MSRRNAKQVNAVYQTTDYSIFKLSPINRSVKTNKALEKSIKTYGFRTVVICDRKMFVIDGQHRVRVAQKLGVPVLYTVINDLDLAVPFVADLQCGKNWTIRNYIAAYKKHGNLNYARFDNFCKKYGLKPSYVLALAFDSESTATLKNGTLKFTSTMEKELAGVASQIADLRSARYGSFQKAFNNTRIAMAIKALLEHDDYEHTHFVKQLNSGKHDHAIFTLNGSYEDGLNMLLQVYNSGKPKTSINIADFFEEEEAA